MTTYVCFCLSQSLSFPMHLMCDFYGVFVINKTINLASENTPKHTISRSKNSEFYRKRHPPQTPLQQGRGRSSLHPSPSAPRYVPTIFAAVTYSKIQYHCNWKQETYVKTSWKVSQYNLICDSPSMALFSIHLRNFRSETNAQHNTINSNNIGTNIKKSLLCYTNILCVIINSNKLMFKLRFVFRKKHVTMETKYLQTDNEKPKWRYKLYLIYLLQ